MARYRDESDYNEYEDIEDFNVDIHDFNDQEKLKESSPDKFNFSL